MSTADLVADAVTKRFAYMQAVDALSRQVREVKDRVKNRKGRGARRIPSTAAVASGPAASGEAAPVASPDV